jgi:ATP-dependent Clp protease adaptor protein ClpS
MATEVATNTKTDFTLPKMYKVILLNDDITTFEFVIFLLKEVFGKSEEEAINLTLKIDREGSGVAGRYPYEIAVMKVEETHQLARKAGYPLRALVEEE